METPVTWTQLVIASIFVLVTALAPQIYQMYARYKDSKDKEIQQKQEADLKKQEHKLTETEKMFNEWENIAGGYGHLLERMRGLEIENGQLRPLVLKVALVQQENKQLKDDKEDWKDYSQRLSDQLESHNIVPFAFRRTPRDGDTNEKMKAISRKMKTVQQELKDRTVTSAAEESPTIVTPPAEDPK